VFEIFAALANLFTATAMASKTAESIGKAIKEGKRKKRERRVRPGPRKAARWLSDKLDGAPVKVGRDARGEILLAYVDEALPVKKYAGYPVVRMDPERMRKKGRRRAPELDLPAGAPPSASGMVVIGYLY